MAKRPATIDPWRLRLERVRGKIDYDGLERVTSQTLLDLLEVPQRSRRAGAFRRVASIMAELGWAPVRVRDLTGRGYKEQVRGYYRDVRNVHPHVSDGRAGHEAHTKGDRPPAPQSGAPDHKTKHLSGTEETVLYHPDSAQ